MLMTTFSYVALALMALTIALHAIRTKGSVPHHFGLVGVSAMMWIVTSFSVIGTMIDLAIHHPESMHPAALLCGTVSAAIALRFGLDAVVSEVLRVGWSRRPAIITSAIAPGTR